MGDWIYPIVWGLIVSIYYRLTSNMMYAAYIGVFLTTTFIAGNAIVVAQRAFEIGFILLAASIEFTLYALWKNKLDAP